MRELLSGYPQLDLHDPDGYIAALVSIACMFEEEVIADVVREGFKYPPGRYEWRQALDAKQMWWSYKAPGRA